MRRLVLCLLAVLAAPAARAQSPSDAALAGLLAGPPLPATLADVDASWRQVTLRVAPPSARAPVHAAGGVLGAYGKAEGASRATALCYTQGRTVEVSGRTYLVALRPAPPVDLSALVGKGDGGPAPSADAFADLAAPALTPQTPLRVWLVDVGGLRELSSPGPVQTAGVRIARVARSQSAILAAILFPVFAQAREKAREMSSLSNVKQLALGVMMYEQDNGRLPPLGSPSAARQAIMPYVRNEGPFLDVATGRPFVPNAALSGRRLSAISRPSEAVLFYASAPDSMGRRAVAFADGHARVVPEADWQRLRRKSGVR